MSRKLSRVYSSWTDDAIQSILDNGMEGILDAMRVLLNEAMLIERSQTLNAQPYERNEQRQGYANGFKPKTVKSRLGKVQVQIPQTRNVEFYPSCLEKGMRSERALNSAMVEMYIHGVATRKVTKVLEKMCGLEVSASQVSRVAQSLDDELEKWRTRPITEVGHLIVDARYEKVRVDSTVRDCALLIAYGVLADGTRSVLGVSVSLSEAQVHWRNFFDSLLKRGMHGLQTITSDDHKGLNAARKRAFGSTPWQRCQFHLQQNANAYIPKKRMQQEVTETIRAIFNAKDREDAEFLLNKAVEKYAQTASELSEWMQQNIPQGLTVFELPPHKRKKLRTSNMAELQNKELKKRTRLIRVFPNKESLLRISSALLMEVDEEWSSAERKYLTM